MKYKVKRLITSWTEEGRVSKREAIIPCIVAGNINESLFYVSNLIIK